MAILKSKLMPTPYVFKGIPPLEPYTSGSHTHYPYDYKSKNEPPEQIIKWCRRNFGNRDEGWTFYKSSGQIIIEIWNDKFKTMYEMWHR